LKKKVGSQDGTQNQTLTSVVHYHGEMKNEKIICHVNFISFAF